MLEKVEAYNTSAHETAHRRFLTQIKATSLLKLEKDCGTPQSKKSQKNSPVRVKDYNGQRWRKKWRIPIFVRLSTLRGGPQVGESRQLNRILGRGWGATLPKMVRSCRIQWAILIDCCIKECRPVPSRTTYLTGSSVRRGLTAWTRAPRYKSYPRATEDIPRTAPNRQGQWISGLWTAYARAFNIGQQAVGEKGSTNTNFWQKQKTEGRRMQDESQSP